MNIQPGYDKMLVRIIKVENKTAAGVFLPGSTSANAETVLLARVEKIGPRLTDHDLYFAEGDYILIPAMTPMFNMKDSPLMFTEGLVGSLTTTMIRIGDVMAKVEPDEGEVMPDCELEAVA